MLAALISAIIVGTCLIGGLKELWPVLHQQWTQVNDYNHGYLMLAAAVWLGFRRWRNSPPSRLAPDWRWLLVFAGALTALLLAEILFLNVPRLYTIPMLVVAAAGGVLGNGVAKRVFWPSMLLYFAMPFWAALAGPLQAVTTGVTTTALRITGIPAYIEGNFVHLPAGTFEIAAGCSGLNYLIVGMSVSALYGLAFLSTWKNRGALFATAVGITLVANWLRVYVIVVAGYLTDMQHYLVKEDHVTFGWWLFGFMLVPVFFFGRRLENREAQCQPLDTAETSEEIGTARPLPLLTTASACGILLLSPLVLSSIGGGVSEYVTKNDLIIREGTVQDVLALPWAPIFDGGLNQRVSVRFHDRVIEVFKVAYPRQTRQARIIRYHHSFTGQNWRPVESTVRDVGGHEVIEFHGYLGGDEALIWAWYSVDGNAVTTPVGVMAMELVALLKGHRSATGYAVATDCRRDCVDAAAKLARFLERNSDAFGLANGPESSPQ